jgi:hypothetical protein
MKRISNRTLWSFVSTLLLLAIVVTSYGLDWRAALWADYHDQPPRPAPSQWHYEKTVIDR